MTDSNPTPASIEDRQGMGVSAEPTGLPMNGAASPSPPSVGIPDAGNSQPDWFMVARGLANAIMFQRSMRGEHTVGRDGRARMGMVDLFGCYAVDTAAREFCEMAGLPFGDVAVPNEHQAFLMAATGRGWADWFTDRDAIIAEAGKSPGRGKVNMKAVAQAIEARRAATTGAVHESAVGSADAPEGGPHG